MLQATPRKSVARIELGFQLCISSAGNNRITNHNKISYFDIEQAKQLFASNEHVQFKIEIEENNQAKRIRKIGRVVDLI